MHRLSATNACWQNQRVASGVGVFQWNGKLDRVPPIWACYLTRSIDNRFLVLQFVLAELYIWRKSQLTWIFWHCPVEKYGKCFGGKRLGDEGCLFTGQTSADASALVVGGSNLFRFNSSMAARWTPCCAFTELAAEVVSSVEWWCAFKLEYSGCTELAATFYPACSGGDLICGVSGRMGCRRSKEKEAEHKWRENRLPELVVCKHAGN